MPDRKSDNIYIYIHQNIRQRICLNIHQMNCQKYIYICLLERQNICQINVSWRGSLDEHVFLLRFGRVLQET